MGLLDLLAEEMNCTYLSDLRYLPRPNAALQRVAADFAIADFFESEWIDAAEYLCGVKCKSANDARNVILMF